ncbi:MAG: caspase family protein [Acidobacteria bacterium]|nr:caspase family protein [Acidobacteriota bacterium]MCI0665877.1 caspase family protein [Acidobacteriota bacterium]
MIKIRIGIAVLLWGILATLALAEDRALVVGIEQYGDTNIKPARGSERDADDVEQFLIRKLNFSPSAIRKLTGARATSKEIVLEFQRWLIKGTRAGDRVFFYYAGHGSYLRDDDGPFYGGQWSVARCTDVRFN